MLLKSIVDSYNQFGDVTGKRYYEFCIADSSMVKPASN